MSAEQLDRLCAQALQRINYFIARKTAQQQRRMRESWAKQLHDKAGHP